MKKMEIDALSDETNAAVVRMPNRQFPGLVVQSDKLIYLNAKGQELLDAAESHGDEKPSRLAENLQYELEQLLETYKAAFNSDSAVE